MNIEVSAQQQNALHQQQQRAGRPWRIAARIAARTAAVVIVLLSLAGLIMALAPLSIDRTPSVEAGQANVRGLKPYWIASFAGWCGLSLLWWSIRSRAAESGRSVLGIVVFIILVGLAVRCVIIATHVPTLSDDIYRYILDGQVTARGENPYLLSPQQLNASDADDPSLAADAALLEQINHPHMTTIYLPTSQWVFWLTAAVLLDDNGSIVAHTRAFRSVLIGFETLAMLLLAFALWRGGRSMWWLALYAWHPLAIVEVAGSGHQDIIGIALLLAALLLAGPTILRTIAFTGLLAAGALVKPVTVPVAALLLRPRTFSKRDIPAALKRATLSAVTGLVVCVIIAGPLLFTNDGKPLQQLRETASTFTEKWAHFGSVYQPVLAGLHAIDPIEDPATEWQKRERHESLARWVCAAGVLAVFTYLLCRPRIDHWAATRTLLFAMVLLAPVAHPWYLLWAMVLLPMGPSAALWIATLTISWGYIVLGDVVDWTVPWWVFVAAYGPVYGMVIAEVVLCRTRGGLYWSVPCRQQKRQLKPAASSLL